MPLDESLKVLSLIDEDGEIPEKLEIDFENLKDRYIDYYVRNDPADGGSEYIRAKINNAKDSICIQFGFDPNIVVPESQAKPDKKEEKKQESKKEKGDNINL